MTQVTSIRYLIHSDHQEESIFISKKKKNMDARLVSKKNNIIIVVRSSVAKFVGASDLLPVTVRPWFDSRFR